MWVQALSAQAVIKPKRRIPEQKIKEVEELAKLVSSSKVIAVFKLVGLRANLIHEIRRKLRNTAIIRIAKKRLFIKAVEKAKRLELSKLVENLKEPVGFIFSNMSAFKLKLIFDKNRIPMHAKAGERADFDIVVPEMNTGLPPGPILSDFGKLGIPTKIEGGQIWIAKDTLVAHKGDEISPALASLLARLDIKAVLKGVTIERAFEEGILLTRDQLEIDLAKISEEVKSAYLQGVALSTEIGYLTRETIKPIIVKCSLEAITLAVEAEIPAKEAIRDIILKAEARAQALKAAAKME